MPQARGPVPELFLWSRAAIWAAAAFAFLWFEPNRHPNAGIWDRPIMHELGWFTDLWARWDSRFFLEIAARLQRKSSGTGLRACGSRSSARRARVSRTR